MLLRRAGTSNRSRREVRTRGEVGDSDTTRAAVLGRLSPGRIPGATTVSAPGADCRIGEGDSGPGDVVGLGARRETL